MREMKNTNINWIGDIPVSWKIGKVKDVFCRKNEKANDDNPIVLSLARSGVKIRDISTGEGQLAESYNNYNPVEIDDLLLNPMDLYSGANCSVSKVKGVISPAYINLRAKGNNNSTYYDYYFKTQYWSMAFFAHGKGVSFDNRWTLGLDTALNYYIPIPNEEEQEKIANFLDNKITEIDNVIEKTKESVEYYKKYKQLVISKIIKNGTNENIRFKNSGIKWIGKVNEEYDVCTMKRICWVNQGLQIPQNDRFDTPGPNRYVYLTVKYLNNVDKENNVEYIENPPINTLCDKDDILMARTGSTGIAITNVCGCFHNNFFKINYDKNKIIKEYLIYYFSQERIKKYLNLLAGTTTIPDLNHDAFYSTPLILPSLLEQQNIVNYLNITCEKIDKLIINKQKLIEELEQYKKSLIYEYVTGKKEVISGKNTEMAELSLRIIEQLPNNYSMCKIKLNKIQSVILKMIKYNREPDYEKHAAGPYSKEMMNDVYETFETKGWVKLSKNGMRDIYTLDVNYKEGIKKYQEHFKEYDNEITRIIKLFENKDTQESEIIATLFYCWNDFLIDGVQPTDDQIIEQFYAWSKRKKYIETSKVKKNLAYMRKNNLIPNGYGKKTIQRSNGYGRK